MRKSVHGKIDPARFHRVYPNLPVPERTNVCCVIDGEPFSWKVARAEILGRTELGLQMLESLSKMELI